MDFRFHMSDEVKHKKVTSDFGQRTRTTCESAFANEEYYRTNDSSFDSYFIRASNASSEKRLRNHNWR
jgi:hypothetical protein